MGNLKGKQEEVSFDSFKMYSGYVPSILAHQVPLPRVIV